MFKRMEDLNKESEEIQQQLMNFLNSIYLKQKDSHIRDNLLDLWKQEEIFWAQKAKANWLKLGDRNTKFFQAQANIRKKVDCISKLQDSSGNWTNDEESIATILIQDFKKRFCQDTTLNTDNIMNFISVIEPVINANDNFLLMQQVTDDEIF